MSAAVRGFTAQALTFLTDVRRVSSPGDGETRFTALADKGNVAFGELLKQLLDRGFCGRKDGIIINVI